MAKNTDAASFFLSQTRKALPRIERDLMKVRGQLDLMIDMSGSKILDATTLLREANSCAKKINELHKQLLAVTGDARGHIRKLGPKDRKAATDNFNGALRTLENRHLKPTIEAALKLQKIARAKSKEGHVSDTPHDPFVVILRVIQILLLMYKKYADDKKRVK